MLQILSEEKLRWKLGCSIVLIGAAATLIIYIGTGLPWPRPWYIFIIAAILTVVLAFHAPWIGQKQPTKTWFSIAGLLTVSWLLRWTPLARPRNTRGDHETFLAAMRELGRSGVLDIGGIYSSAPFLIELPQLWRMIAGASLFQTVVVTNITATFIPVFFFLFIREIIGWRTGWFVAVLSVPFGLFLRGSVLSEPPSIAILWLLLCLFLLAKVDTEADNRFDILFIFALSVSTWIHPYYSVITGIIVIGVLIMRSTERHILYKTSALLPIIGSIAAMIIILYRTQSVWGLAIRGVSSFNISGLIQNPIDTLYPSGGAIGKSLGTKTNANQSFHPVLVSVLNTYQVAVLCTMSAFGGLVIVLKNNRLTIYSVILGIGIPFLFLIRETKHAKYRSYYIIAIFLLILSGVLLSQVWEYRKTMDRRKKAIFLIIFLLVLPSYALLGPVSSIGNDMDPKISGTANVVLPTDYDHIAKLNARMSGSNIQAINAVLETHVVQSGPKSLFSYPQNSTGTNLQVYHNCRIDDKVWTSGRFCAIIVRNN